MRVCIGSYNASRRVLEALYKGSIRALEGSAKLLRAYMRFKHLWSLVLLFIGSIAVPCCGENPKEKLQWSLWVK